MENITQKLQAILKREGFDGILIRSTDPYFNEYVPKENSLRVKITGFSGSVGDAIVLADSAHLFVDGRYALQANNEALGYQVHVTQSGMSIENLWLKFLQDLKPKKIAYDPDLIDLNLWEKMAGLDAFLPLPKNIVSEILVLPKGNNIFSLTKIPLEIAGLPTLEKLKKIKEIFERENIDGFLSTKLDDIAWLSNLRSDYFLNQKTFPAKALVLPDKLFLFFDGQAKDCLTLEDGIVIAHEMKSIFTNKNLKIGIDPKDTSQTHKMLLQNCNVEIKNINNPISLLKAVKNEKELLHLRKAFKKADIAVYKTIKYVDEAINQGKVISEYNVKTTIEDEFKKQGATSLSFQPICANQKNGAIIHYGGATEKEKLLPQSLFLLDTGAYFEGGYATDLTRTFLVAKQGAKALSWQKHMFTLVLKASIKGMNARIRIGTLGGELDAIVRSPLWQMGLDFAHGTGHGVGINVHEFPPRIAPRSLTPLMPNQVFSIEPGLYFAGLGGVRIENLCTIVVDPDDNNFLRILPLTFCPLDERLIDFNMLDESEIKFLKYYQEQFYNDNPMPDLPPLNRIIFGE